MMLSDPRQSRPVRQPRPAAAVENQRRNKQLAKEHRQRVNERREREERNSRWAARMADRRILPADIRLIHLDHRYWLAVSAGWKPDAPMFARNAVGLPCEAIDSVAWQWWCDLHWKSRLLIVRLNRSQRYV